MTVTPVRLPREPRVVPPVEADPATVRAFAADLLAASARVDDLGTFVAGGARLESWAGLAAVAYRDAIRPTGARADAMSLALRHVARRVDAHADALAVLLHRHEVLVGERAGLVGALGGIRERVAGATGEQAPSLQVECDDCERRIHGFEVELDRWVTDLLAEEEAMRGAFGRLLTLEQVDRRYAGVADPADRALDRRPPAGASPAAVAAWWRSLARAAQLALIAAAPGSIGNLAGIPPWARDAANTVALDRDLALWTALERQGELGGDQRQWLANARAARDALDRIRSEDDPVTGEPLDPRLYLYEPTAFGGDGAVAVAVGDLGSAHDTAVLVPGFGTDAQSAPYQAARAVDVYDAARSLGGGGGTAVLSWIGYDAPDNLPWQGDGWDGVGVASEAMATAGGRHLADLVDGLRAAHDGGPAHLTVIGHSYGSTTLGHAAHDEGMPADDLVLVGSPGAGGGADHASDLGIDPRHVWVGADSRDPIAHLGDHGWVNLGALDGAGLGNDPAEDDFGAVRFEAESTTRAGSDLSLAAFADHSKYFDPDTESLYDIAQVVDGHYAAVLRAGPVTDPWYAGFRDPEWDRRPTSPSTGWWGR